MSLGSSLVDEASVFLSQHHLILVSLTVTSQLQRMMYLRQCWRQNWSKPQRSNSKELFSLTLYQLPVETAGEAGETELHVTASLLFWKSNLYWGKNLSDGSCFAAFDPQPSTKSYFFWRTVSIFVMTPPAAELILITWTVRHACSPDHLRIGFCLLMETLKRHKGFISSNVISLLELINWFICSLLKYKCSVENF